MSGLALVPAWFWIALGTVLALAGLVVGVWKSRGRAYRPEHRLRARDVVAVTEAEGRDYYGSMTLDGERKIHYLGAPHGPDVLLWYGDVKAVQYADPMPWEDLQSDARTGEPTAAEVAASRAAHGYIPELDALEAWGPRGPSEDYEAWLAEGTGPPGTCDWGDCDEVSEFWRTDEALGPLPVCARHQDPGPGGLSSLTSGPDQAPTGGDAQGWAGGCAPDESRPAPRADLTGSLSPRHHEEDPGWLAHGQPGLTRLADTGDITAAHHAHPGPDTARLAWLDQQLAAHMEWARRVRGQVTGWGLEEAA